MILVHEPPRLILPLLDGQIVQPPHSALRLIKMRFTNEDSTVPVATQHDQIS
nr:unnamed protein product [Digitaria exilis]